MIVVLVSEQANATEIMFTHEGSFKHGLNARNRRDIHDWCIDQWGIPGEANGWELYLADGYMFARIHSPQAGMNAKMRWHGQPDD